MRSPRDMRIIQIELTNACVHTCSNCSRMCGHHEKPFFMDFQTFKRAVDSMEGYEGTVGMMGGEPTLHPEFERFAEYLASKYPKKSGEKNLIAPTDTFMRNLKLEERSRTEAYEEEAGTNERVKGPGLWSSLVSNYAKHYETIQDTFIYQCVNDHTESSFHQPVMVTRKDLGIPDEEWYPMRDRCWMQMNWSASVTPKGAFFCEIAAALDMLFDGPGGWPIEPGWWKRTPDEFGDQLKWCEWCGLALETRSRDANEGPDDVSPTFLERLKTLNSPKLKRGLVRVYHKDEANDDSLIRHNNYQENDFNRLGQHNRSIYPKGFALAVLPDSTGMNEGLVSRTAESAREQFDQIYVFSDDIKIQGDKIKILPEEMVFGCAVNRINESAGDLYVVCVTQGTELASDFVETMSRYAINPGTMHVFRGGKDRLRLVESNDGSSLMFMYHPSAHTIRDYGYDRIAGCEDADGFISLWKEEKVVTFDDAMLMQNTIEDATHLEAGKKYVVYGTGKVSPVAVRMIGRAGGEVVAFCDSDPAKQGTEIDGIEVIAPEELRLSPDRYDRIVIGSSRYYREIRQKLRDMGIEDAKVSVPLLIDD
ncbi:MAG: hypothetical protein IJT96_09245 [Lachnospiraceae bacterium]|nr:hypothetical protein [Lachnospiraceae bacterium]